MFENLTDRMTNALRNLRGLGKISESNIADALADVRTALLSADVHFRVAREFCDRVKETCLGQNVLAGVAPGQMAVKIIHDELVRLLGENSTQFSQVRPLKVMLVGLHGSGKTTSAGKLARYLRSHGNYRPALVACDVYRPAAIDQLETLATATGTPFYCDRDSKDVPAIGEKFLREAVNNSADLIIFDTAGRLQIDENLIEEIKRLRERIQPDEVLLVADSALGQEAVNVAKHFHEAVNLTGIVLTKLDGDARGGAALSMKTITGVPIKFMGTGEKLEDFSPFHPDRMAQRILGMGDVVSLVEKAQETIDQKEAERLAEKMKKADFDLEDFLAQLQQMKKMGPLGNIMKMMPGMSGLQVGEKEEKKLKRTEAIIQSMTKKERARPEILNGSRRARIAKGSGTKVSDVNALLKQFSQMRQMMKMLKGGKMKALMRGLGGKLPGMGGRFPF
ncbi:MAG: signal recognition particle protein [Opitutales bacterium]|nr:signal recognition particle protein [Opitutales bacterium]